VPGGKVKGRASQSAKRYKNDQFSYFVIYERFIGGGSPSVKPGLKGLARIFAAGGNSLNGIRDAWTHEAAFRQDVVGSIVLLILSVWLADTLVEWLLLIFPLFLLLIVELLNSAIENAIDRIGAERHILSGRAKDMGSSAVFFCLLLIVIVWLSMAWSKFYV